LKKEAKTFVRRGGLKGRRKNSGGLYALMMGLRRPEEKKFFASFFQKRSSCLASPVLRFRS
jgi:hypothetical protein